VLVFVVVVRKEIQVQRVAHGSAARPLWEASLCVNHPSTRASTPVELDSRDMRCGTHSHIGEHGLGGAALKHKGERYRPEVRLGTIWSNSQ
jgi:hypothetical protein